MQNSKKTFSQRENIACPVSGSFSLSPCGSPYVVRYICSPFKTTAFLWIVLIMTSFSCSTTKQPVYFQNLKNDTTLHNIVTPSYELKIQKNDLLGITVASLSPDVAFYNSQQGGAGTNSAGYPVDENGNITFVKLGTLHVEGITRKALKDTLEKALIPYLKDVVVTVSFLNRHVTMMGGISPQVLPLANDNMTILDALAASGDISEKGRIDNVLIIRDKGDAKEFKRLNLGDNSIFYSPYFYLQPNDIVYVEPAKIKTKLTAPQLISYITAGMSLIFLILNALKL